MVFTDHQVRQFYVIDESSKGMSNPEADGVISNHKFYIKYKDPSGKYITTDKISSGCIRDIRITRQPGFVPKVWNIYPSKTSATDTYVLHMIFKNVFGGGVNDFFIKDPAFIAAPGDSIATLVDKLYLAIKNAFRNVGDVTVNSSAVPFYITDNSTHLTITETIPAYNRDSTIRGMFQLGLDLDVHCGYKGNSNNPWGLVNAYSGSSAITALKDYTAENLSNNDYFYHSGILYKSGTSSSAPAMPSTYAETSNFVEYSKGKKLADDTEGALHDSSTYATATAYSEGDYVVHDGKYYKVTAGIASGSNTAFTDLTTTEVTPYPNGPMIAEMEYFFSKGRADLFGYMGFPDINPSEMKANPAKDYYVLDIKYFYQEAGVNNQNSEKELSIASTNKAYLLSLIANSDYSIVNDENAGTAGTQGITLSGGRTCEIFTPIAY